MLSLAVPYGVRGRATTTHIALSKILHSAETWAAMAGRRPAPSSDGRYRLSAVRRTALPSSTA
jgi:hypothetical protein